MLGQKGVSVVRARQINEDEIEIIKRRDQTKGFGYKIIGTD